MIGRRLWQASSRFLWRHPVQLAVALLGVALGVAIMVAVDLANASARHAFLLSQDTVNGEATHQLVGGPAGIPEEHYVALRRLPGMPPMAPVVEGLVSVSGYTLTLIGIDVFAESDIRERPLSSDLGTSAFIRFLRQPGGALVDAASARELGLAAGDAFLVETAGRSFPASLLGEIDPGGRPGLAQLLLVDVATAQEWLGTTGRLSRIDVRITNSEQASAIRERLPPGLILADAEGRSRATADMSRSFGTSLTAMSLLAVLVGGFLIYNSMGFSVVQRRPVIANLRALGVTRREVAGLLALEGCWIVLLGVALGLGLGIALGQVLVDLVVRTINDHYFLVQLSELVPDPASLARGAAIGVLVGAIALGLPLAEAVSVPPGLAMKRSLLEARVRRILPWLNIAGLVCIGACVASLVWLPDTLVPGFAALFLGVVGAALWVPQGLRIGLALLSPVLGKLGGRLARMAVRGVGASLSRTGVAVTALAVAVSATIGVDLMVSSFRSSVSSWLDDTLRADLYVAPPRLAAARSERHLDPELVERILDLPGVVRHSTSRSVDLETGEGGVRIRAVDLPADDRGWFRLTEGDPVAAMEAFQRGDTLVSDSYSYRHEVKAGDRISLPTPRGDRDFRVAGVFRDFDAEQGVVALAGPVYRKVWQDPDLTALGLYVDEGVSADEIAARIRNLAAGYQAVLVRSDGEIRQLSMEVFDRTFRITDVLYLLTVGIAFVGILGALLALQLEQTKDLAVLRALGLTPWQVSALVQLQTGVMGLIAGVLALPMGFGMAWLLIHVINRRAFGWQIDMQFFLAPYWHALVLATVAALLAGLYPAWRMAAVPPAAAMREE